MTCEIRLRDRGPVCVTCGLRVGALSAGVDCPRQREAYGLTSAHDMTAVVRPDGSAGVAVRTAEGGHHDRS